MGGACILLTPGLDLYTKYFCLLLCILVLPFFYSQVCGVAEPYYPIILGPCTIPIHMQSHVMDPGRLMYFNCYGKSQQNKVDVLGKT